MTRRIKKHKGSWPLPVLFLLPFTLSCFSPQTEPVITTLKENAGWCWFQDERAVIRDGILVFGSVADASGLDGEQRDGNVEVTAFDLRGKKPLGIAILHERLEGDDHNVPALLFLRDGRLLAVYSKHNTDTSIRCRITEQPNDYLRWSPEKIIDRDARVTYANVFFLQQENAGQGRIYDFYRGENWNPNYIFSDDDGQTWTYGGRLITFDGRPYVRYASNGRNRIHFITTEHHPRSFDNSLYHAYVEDGSLFRSDGTLIKSLAAGPMSPSDGTRIFAGDSSQVAWGIDIHLDSEEKPFAAYSVQIDDDSTKLVYRYARWDGEAWNDHFLAHAGTALYGRERDYTGLVALDPESPDIVYISADADPVTGAPLISKKDNQPHYEVFKGITDSQGKEWRWTALTSDSDSDNLRPIVPISDADEKVLLWLRGTYSSYTDYDLDAVGMILH